MQPVTTDTTQADFNYQTFFSATKGVFTSFRPDLRLAIDTFRIKDTTQLTAISAHLQLSDSLGLRLDDAGFTLGEGNVHFNARYALDEKKNSPVSVDWKVNDLDFAHLLKEMTSMNLSVPADLKQLGGKLTTSGFLSGTLDDANQHLLFDKAQGNMRFQLTGTELADSPFLLGIGKKAKMRKRFQHLRFAPLAGELRLDSGLITFPRLEIQNTGMQLFVEGSYHLTTGPDLLVSLPLRNIGRGRLNKPPPLTGYAKAGWKVYLVTRPDKDGKPETKFRLGRRRYFKQRGLLEEFKLEKRNFRLKRKE
jgi:hypothetical protein